MEFTGERAIPKEMAENDITLLEHLARYNFAIPYCRDKKVLDAACGAGYGTQMIKAVKGVDISEEAIEYAEENYPCSEYEVCDLEKDSPVGKFDVVVSFETIEHLENPHYFLKKVAENSNLFVFSLPLNNSSSFHKQVYNLEQAKNLISDYFNQIEWYQQEGTEISPLKKESTFLIGIASNNK